MEKKLYRSTTDKMIAGVCGGFAKYFNVDPTLIRVLLVLFCLLGGSGLLFYIVCVVVIPEEPAGTEGGYTPYQDVSGYDPER